MGGEDRLGGRSADRGATRLERVWDATRPPDLSDAAWERIWANVAATRDRGEAPAPWRASSPTDRDGARPWRRAPWIAFAGAQAAALLVAAVWISRRDVSSPPALAGTSTVASIAIPKVEIDQEQVVLIRLDGPTVRVLEINVAQNNEGANAVDPFYAMYNTVEAIAALQ